MCWRDEKNENLNLTPKLYFKNQVLGPVVCAYNPSARLVDIGRSLRLSGQAA